MASTAKDYSCTHPTLAGLWGLFYIFTDTAVGADSHRAFDLFTFAKVTAAIVVIPVAMANN